MSAARGIKAGAAYVELYTKNSRLVKGLKDAETKLKAFGAGITAIGTRISGLGAAIAGPMLASTSVFASMGDTLAKMSGRTGVSVEALSELGYAADQSGANLESLEAAVRRMQKQVVEAASGSASAAESFQRLGISVEYLSSLSPEEQFKLIADRLSQIEDPTLKAAMAMEVFGKSGTKLLPMIADGAAGIEDLQQQARDLGLTISTEDAKAAEVFGDRLDDLWRVLKSTAFTIGASLAPMLVEAAKAVTRIMVMVTDWVKQNKSLVVWLFKIAVATVGAGAALVALGTTISGIGAAMGMAATVATGIGTAIATLGSVLASILSPIGLVIAGVVGLAGYLLYVSGVGGKALTWLSSMFMNLKSTALAAFQGITDALAAGDMALAAKILWLTLKMEWQRGVGWLQEKWIGFKEYFLSVWTDAVYGLSKIMTSAWAGLQSVWTETVAAMSTAWTVFSSGAVSAWKGAQNFIAKGIVRLMGMLDDSVDVEGTMNILQGDFERDEQSRQKATQAQLQNIETGRQRRQSDIENQRTGTIDNLEQDRQRTQADQKRRLGGDLKQSEQALAEARREWEKALAEAAAKRMDAQAGQGPESIKRAELELDGLDDVIDSTRQKVDVVGTFNPLAAVSLSSDSLGERTAKASEQVAANTKRLVQEAQLGGLVFS
jgi:hypothetical protein